MTAISYYRWSLLQPVLLPALAFPSFLKGEPVASIFVDVCLFCAPPYAIWAIYILLRLCGKGEAEVCCLAKRAPVQLAVANLLASVVFYIYQCSSLGDYSWGLHYFTNGMPPLERVFFGMVLGVIIGFLGVFPLTVAVGYLWVAYVNGTLKRLKRWGWVESAPNNAVS